MNLYINFCLISEGLSKVMPHFSHEHCTWQFFVQQKNNYGSGLTDLCDIFGLKFETRILLGCFHTFPLVLVGRILWYIKTVS